MLRVNVGLSRKLSKDYNSTGFSINLDGEISAPVSDAEAVVEQVKELFDLAEEALDREIESHQSISAQAAHEEPPPENGNGRHQPTNRVRQYGGNGNGQNGGNGQAATNGQRQNGAPTQGDGATNKQVNYLLNIGKRQRLSTVQLEQRIEEILGQPVGLYDLSKRDAAQVIDALTGEGSPANGRAASNRRA